MKGNLYPKVNEEDQLEALDWRFQVYCTDKCVQDPSCTVEVALSNKLDLSDVDDAFENEDSEVPWAKHLQFHVRTPPISITKREKLDFMTEADSSMDADLPLVRKSPGMEHGAILEFGDIPLTLTTPAFGIYEQELDADEAMDGPMLVRVTATVNGKAYHHYNQKTVANVPGVTGMSKEPQVPNLPFWCSNTWPNVEYNEEHDQKRLQEDWQGKYCDTKYSALKKIWVMTQTCSHYKFEGVPADDSAKLEDLTSKLLEECATYAGRPCLVFDTDGALCENTQGQLQARLIDWSENSRFQRKEELRAFIEQNQDTVKDLMEGGGEDAAAVITPFEGWFVEAGDKTGDAGTVSAMYRFQRATQALREQFRQLQRKAKESLKKVVG